MRLSEMLKPQNIKLGLAAKNKTDAIKELVDLLAANNELKDPAVVLAAVLDREATRTTGIGQGLAIPHGKCPGTDHLVMAVGRPSVPIDFQSIDGRPVNWIWLLASPAD
jgi:mannitol/fructose-specific phosphotransferase system IIA component (Ntr-type)